MATFEKPQHPKRLTPESVAAYKSATRVYDAERIRLGLATPWQVQMQNSVVPFSAPLPTILRPIVPAAVVRMARRAR